MFLQQCWYKKSPWLYALVPLSWLYRGVIAAKGLCYQRGWLKITRFSVPLIVVGNLTVGGTGKTPLIIALANYLSAQGYRIGIVSRGYTAKARHFPLSVTSQSDASEVGDEPLLIARRSKCPVVIAPDRVAAVKALLASNPCDVILSDDGLQHYAMGRMLEIVVIDGERRFGNAWCLPAGPLREPIARLKTVDFIVCHGEPRAGEWQMSLIPGEIYNLRKPSRHFSLKEAAVVHAVAGIGNPGRFFRQLRAMGFVVIEHAFPDHYHYRASDLEFDPNSIVIMTEKDAVKCQNFAKDNVWCLPVQADCDLIQVIEQLIMENQHGQNSRSVRIKQKVR